MQTDIVIEIIKFARQNFINGGDGLSLEEIYNFLILKKLIRDDLSDKEKINILVGQIFTSSGTKNGKMMLKVDSYFALIEYEELQ